MARSGDMDDKGEGSLVARAATTTTVKGRGLRWLAAATAAAVLIISKRRFFFFIFFCFSLFLHKKSEII